MLTAKYVLPVPRRSDAENHVVLLDRLEIELLLIERRLGRDVAFTGLESFRARNHAPQALRCVLRNDPDNGFQIAVCKLHTLGAQLSVVSRDVRLN